jgi:ArsR family transcriptional regulator
VALADPTRLEIIEYLAAGERGVCEIIPALQRSKSTISKHLKILSEAESWIAALMAYTG